MNKKIIALLVLVAAVVVTGYSVSGTYAKYTSTFTDESSAVVAKWSFNIDGKAAETTKLTLDIFKTAKEDSLKTKNVNSENGMIAPGSYGTKAIKVVNNSDVKATLSFAIKEKDGEYENKATGLPIKFAVTKSESAPEQDEGYYTMEELQSHLTEVATTNLDDDAEHIIYVHWKWIDDTNGATDTPFGTAAATENKTSYIVEITLTATQAAVSSTGA